ncbi:SDR family NAD(P)-dependent oxidoreductase [Flagellimonas amoyensis]|uniref:SDR family NAD(P)-dependent oxidoreductase n=1 Tax=Flagellimonas amoyensis TaxID=2169401 RepID=UPI000D353198|nr:SDR family NAD(P)-dependent oxidoreductase [Allomuricauda amoyensis]
MKQRQTVLITGASSGIGLQLANQLHDRGYHVIGTTRNPKRIPVPFQMMTLDITDEDSIEAFTNELFDAIGQLDVLVNNAGYMLVGLAEETPLELGKKQFDTNFWGTIALTNAILPHFRRQKSGQIITMSSMMGLIGLPNKSFYSASKHAIEGYFKSLRFELDQFNIKVNLVEPMWSKTNLKHNLVTTVAKIPEYDFYRKQADAYLKRSLESAERPDVVVDAILKLIRSKSSKFRNPVGKMSRMIFFLQNHAYKMFEGAIQKEVDRFKG